MGQKQSRPVAVAAAVAVACVTRLPAQAHAFSTPMHMAHTTAIKSSRQFLYLGEDGESVPINKGAKKNKPKPDLIIPPTLLGVDEAWAAQMELEMEMNMGHLDDDFEDDKEETPLLDVKDKAEALHRSLLKARLDGEREKRAPAVGDSNTPASFVMRDGDVLGDDLLESVRMQVETTSQNLDTALADIDGLATEATFEQQSATETFKDTTGEDTEQEETIEVTHEPRMQQTDKQIYRAFLSQKEKRLEEALRAAEEYEKLAAQALRKAQEEEQIRLTRLALIQRLTAEAVRQAEKERDQLAEKTATRSEALHRSLLKKRLKQKPIPTDTSFFSDSMTIPTVEIEKKKESGAVVSGKTFVPERRNVEPAPDFAFHRSLLGARLKMEAKAKEVAVNTDSLAHFKFGKNKVTESAIPKEVAGVATITVEDSQPGRNYFFINEGPSPAKEEKKFSSRESEEASFADKEQDFERTKDKFSFPSLFVDAIDSVGEALDTMDNAFAKWIESRSNPKATGTMTATKKESYRKQDERVRTDSPAFVQHHKQPQRLEATRKSRPTFILKGSKPTKTSSYISEPAVFENREGASTVASTAMSLNTDVDSALSTGPSSEQEERLQPNKKKVNRRPTYVLRKGTGGSKPEKDESEPQVERDQLPITLSHQQTVSHTNTTTTLMNAFKPESSVSELKEEEDSVIVKAAVAHLSKSAWSGGRAAFFTFGAVFEAATSDEVADSARAASSCVSEAFQTISNSFTNTNTVEDPADGDNVREIANGVARAGSSVCVVGGAFLRSFESTSLSSDAIEAVSESTKACVSFLASLTAFGIKQGERALFRFSEEENPNLDEDIGPAGQAAIGDTPLNDVYTPDKMPGNFMGGNRVKLEQHTAVGTTEIRNRLEVANFQKTQDASNTRKSQIEAETKELFRSIFHL